MPFWSGGAIYVPYTLFDPNLNGINVSLGLYTSFNRSSGTVTIFNLRQSPFSYRLFYYTIV